VSGLIGDGPALGLESLGPVDDQGRRNTALMLVLFVQAEGRVTGMGPACVVGPVGLRIPGFEIAALSALEGTGAVVGTGSGLGLSFHFVGMRPDLSWRRCLSMRS
jgi:hypothetical protein